jgi:hypothetical protein
MRRRLCRRTRNLLQINPGVTLKTDNEKGENENEITGLYYQIEHPGF